MVAGLVGHYSLPTGPLSFEVCLQGLFSEPLNFFKKNLEFGKLENIYFEEVLLRGW